MLASLIKTTASAIRANVILNGCRNYARGRRENPFKIKQDHRPSQQNVEDNNDFDDDHNYENVREDKSMLGKEIELNVNEIVSADEEFKTVLKYTEENEDIRKNKKKKKEKDKYIDFQRRGIVELGGATFKYLVVGKDTKELSKEVALCKSAKGREKEQKIMLEGKRLIYDALTAKLQPLKFFFTRTEELKNFKLPINVELYKICYNEMKVWSDVKTPQGVIGIFQLPNVELLKPSPNSLPLTIICDQVRDPGNMGSIIRIAASVGCSQLILTKGCVDLWEPKVLRTAAGAHFRIPIYKSKTWEEISTILPENYSLYLADSDSPQELDFENEESLQTKERGIAFKKKFMLSDSVPLASYYSQRYWFKESVVLVIGGETAGLSLNAYELAIEKQGKRVYVPLCNGIESLNSSIALSVLSYEMRRQFDNPSEKDIKVENSNSEAYKAVGLYSE